jgi:hypothetical protein
MRPPFGLQENKTSGKSRYKKPILAYGKEADFGVFIRKYNKNGVTRCWD